MFLYAIGTLPLIHHLKRHCSCTQIWYADDASACGTFSDLFQWFELLLVRGADFGYFPNPVKCRVVVNNSFKADAEQVFAPLGIPVVCNHHYLGRFLGEPAGRDAFVQDKVNQWIVNVQSLSKMAEKQPQAAFSALTKSLQCEAIPVYCLLLLPLHLILQHCPLQSSSNNWIRSTHQLPFLGHHIHQPVGDPVGADNC